MKTKPTGGKNYGSIAHLSNSKIDQQTDKYISEGQERIATKKVRDYKDLIIIQEKLDGSNVGVYKERGVLYPLTRAGYSADTSPYEQHKQFYFWVFNNSYIFQDILMDGERITGEWMLQTHSIKYKLHHSPFVPFDIFDRGNERLIYLEFIKRTANYGIPLPKLVHIGQPLDTTRARKIFGKGGAGAIDEPEGLVYRVEREGRVDFLCKYVRPNKIDGQYMKDEIYNLGWEKFI